MSELLVVAFSIVVLFWLGSILVAAGVIKGPIRKWYHDKLGWHDGKGQGWFFDGCSVHSICSQCGEEVMQDGQGNWF